MSHSKTDDGRVRETTKNIFAVSSLIDFLYNMIYIELLHRIYLCVSIPQYSKDDISKHSSSLENNHTILINK